MHGVQVACETATKTDLVMIFGEITTTAKVDYEKVVRDTCRGIGFTSADVGLDADTCKVALALQLYWPDSASAASPGPYPQTYSHQLVTELQHRLHLAWQGTLLCACLSKDWEKG